MIPIRKIATLFALLFMALPQIKAQEPATALPPNVCKLENGNLVFYIDLRWTEKQKKELSRMENQAQELEKQLTEEIKKGEIRLKKYHDRIIINIDDRISFDSGQSELKKNFLPTLEKISKILAQYPEYYIIIEGHTDDVPIKTARFRNNWQLSTERALAVLDYLLKNTELDPRRFSAAGYGEYRPVVSNDTKENRALNRRVDIVVIPIVKKAGK